MPNPTNLTNAEYAARLFTYTEIQNAHCHLVWPPEFSDLAMDDFPGMSFAQLVENEEFHLGCTAILQVGYRDVSFGVSATTLAEAARDPLLPLLDAYLRRELGRFGKRWKTTVHFKHRAKCLSILLSCLVDIMWWFRVAEIDGEHIVARRCANYCSAFMTGAWRPLQRLVFAGKGNHRTLVEERVSTDNKHVMDPFDVFSLRSYKESERVPLHDDLLDTLTKIIGEELDSSPHPKALRGLLSGTVATKDASASLKKSPTWISAQLVGSFVRSVQIRLRQAGLATRSNGKADSRILRKAIPACIPGISAASKTITSDQFPDASMPGSTVG